MTMNLLLEATALSSTPMLTSKDIHWMAAILGVPRYENAWFPATLMTAAETIMRREEGWLLHYIHGNGNPHYVPDPNDPLLYGGSPGCGMALSKWPWCLVPQ